MNGSLGERMYSEEVLGQGMVHLLGRRNFPENIHLLRKFPRAPSPLWAILNPSSSLLALLSSPKLPKYEVNTLYFSVSENYNLL